MEKHIFAVLISCNYIISLSTDRDSPIDREGERENAQCQESDNDDRRDDYGDLGNKK